MGGGWQVKVYSQQRAGQSGEWRKFLFFTLLPFRTQLVGLLRGLVLVSGGGPENAVAALPSAAFPRSRRQSPHRPTSTPHTCSGAGERT